MSLRTSPKETHSNSYTGFLLLSLAFCIFVCELDGIAFPFRRWKISRLSPAESCILCIPGYAGNVWQAISSSGSRAEVCAGKEGVRPRARCSPTPDQEHPLAASASEVPAYPRNKNLLEDGEKSATEGNGQKPKGYSQDEGYLSRSHVKLNGRQFSSEPRVAQKPLSLSALENPYHQGTSSAVLWHVRKQ